MSLSVAYDITMAKINIRFSVTKQEHSGPLLGKTGGEGGQFVVVIVA